MASAKQLEERENNLSAIISFVRVRGAATRMEVCEGLSLSWACVSELIGILIDENVLIESTQDTNGMTSAAKGRTPKYVTLNKQKYFLGVDINDSGIAITTISMNGESMQARKWEAEWFQNEAALVASVCEKTSQMLENAADCCGIGVAMEGARSDDGGYLYPFTGGFISIHPEVFLANRFDLPVVVRHDPECVLYSIVNSFDKDCIAVRVDNGIGVAAMKHGKILDLPLELGFAVYGSFRLKDILRHCAKTGDYRKIAEALGYSAANLAMLLGAKRCFVAGGVTKWFGDVSSLFDAAFKNVSPKLEYEICHVPDASDGAARVAMAEFSVTKHSRKEGSVHE